MSDDGLEAVLADALHAQIDGDFLVAASRWEKGADVALSTASATEVVWWAVNAVAPAVRAHLAVTLAAAHEDVLDNGSMEDFRAVAAEAVGLRRGIEDLAEKFERWASLEEGDDVVDLRPEYVARWLRAVIAARLTPTDGAP